MILLSNFFTALPPQIVSQGRSRLPSHDLCNAGRLLSVFSSLRASIGVVSYCASRQLNFTNNKMTIDFYYTPGSSPCRNVLLAAKAAGVDLNLKELDLMKGEHLSPEFVKINPQHCVPALDDNGFVLVESRAIMTYLVSKYGKDESLYPKDPQKRAVVDQRLYFDMGVLYQRFGDLYYPIIFGGAPRDEEKAKKLDEAYKFLDLFLGKTAYAAGDNLTVADLALVASVSSAEACDWDISKYPNVAKWLAKCKTTVPGYAEANQKGIDKFKGMYLASKK